MLVARAEIARQSQSIVCSDVDSRSSGLTGHASTALYSVVLNAEQMPSQNEPGIRASVRHRNQELVYKRESIDLGAVTIARVCEGCELVRLEHRQSSGGWLVGWLVFILRLLMGIKSTISPPEGHIRRAKLWNYSADTLP